MLSNIDGGPGTDTVNLSGDYSSGLTLFSSTLQNVAILNVAGGHSYQIITADGNIAAGATLTVNATSLQAGNFLTLDGSAKTDGSFIVNGGAGNVTFVGGHGNDTQRRQRLGHGRIQPRRKRDHGRPVERGAAGDWRQRGHGRASSASTM